MGLRDRVLGWLLGDLVLADRALAEENDRLRVLLGELEGIQALYDHEMRKEARRLEQARSEAFRFRIHVGELEKQIEEMAKERRR